MNNEERQRKKEEKLAKEMARLEEMCVYEKQYEDRGYILSLIHI